MTLNKTKSRFSMGNLLFLFGGFYGLSLGNLLKYFTATRHKFAVEIF
jgi:hypothetical protein